MKNERAHDEVLPRVRAEEMRVIDECEESQSVECTATLSVQLHSYILSFLFTPERVVFSCIINYYCQSGLD